MTRKILRTDIDSMELLEELASSSTTDGRGLTLGDVEGHRHDRYLASYRALHLVGQLAHTGLLSRASTLDPIGAEVQDKTGIDAFHAAHVLPCDLRINGRKGLHQLFDSPIISGNVQARLFGVTNVLHKLVNYADRRCEANGWIATFEGAMRSVLRGRDPRLVFDHELVPGYAQAVEAARERLLAALRTGERAVIDRPTLWGPDGQPARRRAQDFRVGDKVRDVDVTGANKAAVLLVFDDYRLGQAGIPPSLLAQARDEGRSWAELEGQWRAKHR